jgi:hypothetical protein
LIITVRFKEKCIRVLVDLSYIIIWRMQTVLTLTDFMNGTLSTYSALLERADQETVLAGFAQESCSLWWV